MVGLALMLAMQAGTTQGYLSGTELYAYCQKAVRPECLNFVIGVVDTVQGMTDAGLTKKLFCVPSDATVGQLANIVQAYLRANPAKQPSGASGIVALAMIAAFPCETT